jgi:hypothetical protein
VAYVSNESGRNEVYVQSFPWIPKLPYGAANFRLRRHPGLGRFLYQVN